MSVVDRETLSILSARCRAAIIRRIDGKPIRSIRPGHRTVPVGIVASVKNALPIAYEGPSELLAIRILEGDPSVVGYQTQPHLLRMYVGDGHLDYFPDIEGSCADGLVRITEVKGARDGRWLAPDYRRKLELAAEVYHSMGWTFDVVHEDDLRASRTCRAAVGMWASRLVVIPKQLVYAAVQAAASGTVSRQSMIELLGGEQLGEARLDALAIRRLVTWAEFWSRKPTALCRPVNGTETWGGWA